MTENVQHVLMTVLSGTFVNQAAAFYALRVEGEQIGINVRPDMTDVIREAREVRLAHYFRPAIVARIDEARGKDDTLLLLFPSLLTAEPQFPRDRSALRLLGRYAGRMTSE